MASRLDYSGFDSDFIFVLIDYLKDKEIIEYSPNEQERKYPELISQRIYNTDRLAWLVSIYANNIRYFDLLSKYNNLILPKNVRDIREGIIIMQNYSE